MFGYGWVEVSVSFHQGQEIISYFFLFFLVLFVFFAFFCIITQTILLCQLGTSAVMSVSQ